MDRDALLKDLYHVPMPRPGEGRARWQEGTAGYQQPDVTPGEPEYAPHEIVYQNPDGSFEDERGNHLVAHAGGFVYPQSLPPELRMDLLSDTVFADREARKAYSQSPQQILDRVKSGAAVGTGLGLFGGAGGAAVGGTVGAISGLVGGLAEYASADPTTGDVTEFLTDPALGVARQVPKVLGHLPGGVNAQARRLVDEMGGPVQGRVSIGDVRGHVEEGYGVARDRTNEAYDAWRESVGMASLPEETVASAITRPYRSGTPGEFTTKPSFITRAESAEGGWNAARLDAFRREVTSELSAANLRGDKAAAHRMGEVLKEVDELEDWLSQAGPNALASKKLLDEARALRRHPQGYIESGLEGADTAVESNILGPKQPETDAAILNILKGKRPVEAVRQMRTAARQLPPGQRAEMEEGLRDTYLEFIFSRDETVIGGPTHKGPALHKKILKYELIGKEILGEGRWKQLEQNARAVSAAEGGKSYDVGVVPISNPRDSRRSLGIDLVKYFGAGSGFGATAGAWAGQVDPLVTAAGGAAGLGVLGAGRVLGSIFEQYGADAARRIALSALTDAQLLRQISRKAGMKEGVALARRAVESAARRGIVLAVRPDDPLKEGATVSVPRRIEIRE